MSFLNESLELADGWHEILPQARPNVRMFWREFLDRDTPIGASDGQETRYVLVKYDCTGTVHGQPIARRELRKKGADL
jgi:hypothetical protein